MERALGETATVELRKQLAFWKTTNNLEAIEDWRHRQVARMFSLSEFVKCLKFRFTRWYNRKNRRKGVLWESRFTSVMVEEEERTGTVQFEGASAMHSTGGEAQDARG